MLQRLQQQPNRVLDEAQVEAGISYVGHNARLRRLMRRLGQGEAITLGVVGGSISTCCDGTSGYHRMAFDWISRTFPAAAPAAHAFHNGATGGIQSQYMTSCLKWHLPATVDLVIVEFAVNDGSEAFHCTTLPCAYEYGGINSPVRRSYERLLRKLLVLPNRPAVILLQAFRGFVENGRTFLNSAEDQLGVFAQYYGLPQLSLRDVVWHETEAGAPGFALEDIMLPNGGNIHPNERGHGMMTDLIAGLLRRTGEAMATRRPYSDADERRVTAELPPPVLPGNVAHDTEYCILDNKFRDLVTERQGFDWVDEAKPDSYVPKLGYVATVPGSLLKFTVDTSSTTQTGAADPHTVVTLSHMKSYEGMGQAEVSCVAGCTCDARTLDGHWEHRSSQLQQFAISASQAPACTVQVRVLDTTSSEGHKVKVQGVIVAEEQTEAGDIPVILPQVGIPLVGDHVVASQ